MAVTIIFHKRRHWPCPIDKEADAQRHIVWCLFGRLGGLHGMVSKIPFSLTNEVKALICNIMLRFQCKMQLDCVVGTDYE